MFPPPSTPFCVYSTSKAVTAFVVHKLAERGLLDLDDPVAAYIPGYEKNRKHDITVGYVLAHRAGVPNLPRRALDLDRLNDREYLTDILVNAVPFAKPGRYLAYHAVSGGFILGEVVRAATGGTSGRWWPSSSTRSVRWTNYGVARRTLTRSRVTITGPPTTPPLSNLLTRALGVEVGCAGQSHQTLPHRNRAGGQHGDDGVEMSRFFEITAAAASWTGCG